MRRTQLVRATSTLLSLLVICATLEAVKADYTHGRKLQAYGQRQEWRQLTPQQQTDFLNAIKCMKARPESYGDASQWNYNQYVRFHAESAYDVHGNGFFLPWHRYTLVKFEQALQSCHPAQATRPLYLPFWDYALDAGDLMGAPVWNGATFGSNGVPSQGDCVLDGQFTSATFPITVNPIGGKSCLQRAYISDGTWTGDSPATVAQGLNDAANFAALTGFVDYGPHGRIHNGINGNMWYVTSSANDPIFWLIHAAVDRMWSRWQNSFRGRCYNAMARDWNNGTNTNLDTPLPGWGAVTVRTCILTTNKACNYIYSDTAADRQLLPPCPAKRLSSRLLRSATEQAFVSVGGLRSVLQAPQDNPGQGQEKSGGVAGGVGAVLGGLAGNGGAKGVEIVGIVADLLKGVGVGLQRVKDTNFQCQLPFNARSDKDHVCYPLEVADEWFTFHKMDPAIGRAVQQQAIAATDKANKLFDQKGILP